MPPGSAREGRDHLRLPQSDQNVMSKAGAMLDRFGVSYEEV